MKQILGAAATLCCIVAIVGHAVLYTPYRLASATTRDSRRQHNHSALRSDGAGVGAASGDPQLSRPAATRSECEDRRLRRPAARTGRRDVRPDVQVCTAVPALCSAGTASQRGMPCWKYWYGANEPVCLVCCKLCRSTSGLAWSPCILQGRTLTLVISML